MHRLFAAFLIVASLLFLSAQPGDAQPKAKIQDKLKGLKLDKADPEKFFKQLDANGDGKLTKEEFTKMADKITDKLPDENLKDKLKQSLGKAFERIANGKESVTLEEFKKLREKKTPEAK